MELDKEIGNSEFERSQLFLNSSLIFVQNPKISIFNINDLLKYLFEEEKKGNKDKMKIKTRLDISTFIGVLFVTIIGITTCQIDIDSRDH